MFRGIWYGFKNLIYYFSTVWQDRDWDNWYFFKLIERKLYRWEQHERKYGNHVNSLRDAHNIKICKLLCKRIMEDCYTTPFDKRNEPSFKKFLKAFENPMKEKGLCRVIYNPTGLERKIGRWKYEHESYMKKQDLNLLFKILEKHILGWWN